jgi:hypothetical protein
MSPTCFFERCSFSFEKAANLVHLKGRVYFGFYIKFIIIMSDDLVIVSVFSNLLDRPFQSTRAQHQKAFGEEASEREYARATQHEVLPKRSMKSYQ